MPVLVGVERSSRSVVGLGEHFLPCGGLSAGVSSSLICSVMPSHRLPGVAPRQTA